MSRLPLAVFFVLALTRWGWAQTVPEGFFIDNIAPEFSFDTPVGIAVAPDGRVFVAELGGRVMVVESSIARTFIDLSAEVFAANDRGLLGIALDPEFDTNGYVYLLYTFDHDGSGDRLNRNDVAGRLTRYSASRSDPNTAEPQSRKVLLGETYAEGFPACFKSHSPGSVRFGTDGTLLVGSGDAAQFEFADAGGHYPDCFGPELFSADEDIGAFRAQYLGSYSGKILRLDPQTGLGLPSNPFYTGDPSDAQSRIWVYGLRNPFRFSLRSDGSTSPAEGNPGALFIGDVGWSTWEEINFSRTGGENFGWPCDDGPEPSSAYGEVTPAHSGCSSLGVTTVPVAYWHHHDPDLSHPPGLRASSLIMGPVYSGTRYPPQYRQRLFYADFVRGWMAYAAVDEEGNLTGDSVFSPDIGRVVDIVYGAATESIYYVDIFENAVYRIRYGENDPRTSVQVTEASGRPEVDVLFQAFPNPFNSGTSIRYALREASRTQLKVYSMAGHEVVTLVDGYRGAGHHSVHWDGTDRLGRPLPSGVYVYRIVSGGLVQSRKLVSIR